MSIEYEHMKEAYNNGWNDAVNAVKCGELKIERPASADSMAVIADAILQLANAIRSLR